MTIFKIYSLTCPIENKIKYIGCTKLTLKERLRNHKSSHLSYNTKKDKWVKMLFKKGLHPKINLIENANELNKSEKEQYWIDFYCKNNLYNVNRVMKKSKPKKSTIKKEMTKKIEIRVSEFEKNRIKWLADKYANGNVSLYLIYHGMNAPRKEIDPENLKEYSSRHKK